MSCHDVGRAINSVGRVVIEEYDKGAINLDAAKRILNECCNAVNWCDGNSDEASDYFRRCRCGNCLKMIKQGENLYSIWHTSINSTYEIEEKYDLASDSLCDNCFDTIISEYYNDKSLCKEEKSRIKERYEEKYYISEGKYSETNNGCRWPQRFSSNI